MNVVITEGFKKSFYGIFNLEKELFQFSNKLKNTKQIKLISPYLKYKMIVSGIHIRWIYVMIINNNLIPIFITKKSNKTYWNNLLIDKKNIDFFKLRYEKSINDIENNKYIII